MRVRSLAAVVLVLLLAPAAHAQAPESFAALPLRVNLGDTLTVVTDDGRRTRGRLIGITPAELVLRTDRARSVSLPAAGIREVAKRGRDSLTNGALVGLGAGAALGLAGGLMGWDDTGNPAGSYALLFAGFFSGVGTLVDAAIRHDTIVFRAPAVSLRPLVGPARRGLVVVLRW
jgi:hypothetical protein